MNWLFCWMYHDFLSLITNFTLCSNVNFFIYPEINPLIWIISRLWNMKMFSPCSILTTRKKQRVSKDSRFKAIIIYADQNNNDDENLILDKRWSVSFQVVQFEYSCNEHIEIRDQLKVLGNTQHLKLLLWGY